MSFENREDAVLYLQNFWEPQLGSNVALNGQRKKIVKIEPEYEEQIFLEGESQVFFIQDLEWHPSNKEVQKVLEDKFSLVFCPDCVRYQKQFFPKPSKMQDFANIALQLRHISNYSIV